MTDGQVIILIISVALFGMFFIALLDELIVNDLRKFIKERNCKMQRDYDSRIKALREECEFKLGLYRKWKEVK